MLRRSHGVHKVEPCDICGDVGFAEVIVTCAKCNVFREHIYCMRKNLMEIPDYWLCESCQCQPKNGTTSPCKVKLDFGSQASKRQQPARKGPSGKVKYLNEDEVIKLSSSNFSMKITPASSSLPTTRKAIPGSSTFSMTKRVHVAYKSVVPNNPSLSLKQNPCIAPMPHVNFPRNEVRKNSMTDQHASPSTGLTKEKRLESERRVGLPIPDQKVQTLDLQIEKPAKTAPYKDIPATTSSPVDVSGPVADCNRLNIEKNNIQSIHENLHHDIKYLPSSVCSWSGQFQILEADASGDFYDGFQAQPPCFVNRKAYNLSNKIPSVLQLESLPALNVFQNYSPTLQDIALYFFPSNKNERENLHNLLKSMNAENSMLKSSIDGVELLVFTSHKLSEDSRGTVAAVYEGYFLWGVFRSTKTNTANEILPDMSPVDMDIDMIRGNDVDMDIDMIGGNDVSGRIDNVLNDNLRSPSQLPFEGTYLQNYISKKAEEKSLIPLTNLNGRDKSNFKGDLKKKIKTEHSTDPPLRSPVKKYRQLLDILDVPPGFEAHGHSAVKPSNMKR